ncbi:MAG: DUF4363 family protein [Oscillospiraceae bacterium]|nr:DUF4363 family protein [Oscillospiraceae bacterium]
MKRVITSLVLLPLMLGFSLFSMNKVNYLEGAVLRMTTEILEASNAEETRRLIDEVEGLVSFWKKEERVFRILVRHNQVESIGIAIARLPALAKHGSKSDLQSEVLAIRWEISDIKNTEAFKLGNVF